MQRPSGDWAATGKSLPNLIGGYTMPPGTNGSVGARKLLANVIAVLYSCVGSAQGAPRMENEQDHAVQQMVIANSALAVGEADAFLTLVSAGLEGPACIHLRTIGELATRIVLCIKRPDLALKLYRSWGPTWERLVRRQMPEVEFDGDMDTAARDMRQLEQSQEFKEARAHVFADLRIMNDMERTMWSKRSHGDIYALVQVSVNLANRPDGDVKTPIVSKLPYGVAREILLSRAIGNLLVVATHLVAAFQIRVPQEVLTGLANGYEALLKTAPRVPRVTSTD